MGKGVDQSARSLPWKVETYARQFDVGVDPRGLRPTTLPELLKKQSSRIRLKDTAHAE